MLGANGDRWLIRLHMQIARELLAQGWSQSEVAKLLGTTQSTVSRQSTRPLPTLAGSSDEAAVDILAVDMVKNILQQGPGQRVRRQRILGQVQLERGSEFNFDLTLTGTDLDAGQKRLRLLKNLQWAVGRLQVDLLRPWLPEVGMNIAACTEEAESALDVAAFPGRLTPVGKRLRFVDEPQYNASRHLSEILLKIRDEDSDKSAIMNLRAVTPSQTEVNTALVDKVTEKLNWKMAKCPKGLVPVGVGDIDLLVDKGGFGWEPAFYLVASEPIELVEKAHQLVSELTQEGE